MTLFRYIALEILVPTFGGLALLLLVFAAWSATDILADAVAGRVQGSAVAALIGLRCVIAAEVILPTAFFGATVWALVRLDRDSELAIIHGAGLASARLYLFLGSLAVLMGIAVAFLSLEARPWAYRTSYELESRVLPDDIGLLESGRFYRFADEMTLFSSSVDRPGSTMEDVFAERALPDGFEVIRAREFRLGRLRPEDTERLLEFRNGQAWWIRDPQHGDRIHAFERLFYRATPPPADDGSTRRRAMRTGQLFASERSRDIGEWQWRLLTGPLTVVMALMAVQIGHGRPREGVYGRLIVALVCWIVVFNLAAMGRTWVENGDLATWPGLWWVLLVPPILMLLHRLLRRTS